MGKLLIIGTQDTKELEFEEVLNMYKPLIINEILNFDNLNSDFDDKYQMASISLWDAYNRYDIKFGIGFGLLAKTSIENKFKCELERQNRIKRAKFITISADKINDSEDGWTDSILNVIPSIENVEHYVMIKTLLSQFMSELNDKQKETLSLYINGKSYNQISEILHSKPSTVRMRIMKVRNDLEKIIL